MEGRASVNQHTETKKQQNLRAESPATWDGAFTSPAKTRIEGKSKKFHLSDTYH